MPRLIAFAALALFAAAPAAAAETARLQAEIVRIAKPVDGTVGVAANIGLLNQALHTLWKADYFHATLDASQFGGFSTGPATPDDDPVMVVVDARLPPVAYLDNGVVKLDLGDVDLSIGNSQSATSLTVGIRAHAQPHAKSVRHLGGSMRERDADGKHRHPVFTARVPALAPAEGALVAAEYFHDAAGVLGRE